MAQSLYDIRPPMATNSAVSYPKLSSTPSSKARISVLQRNDLYPSSSISIYTPAYDHYQPCSEYESGSDGGNMGSHTDMSQQLPTPADFESSGLSDSELSSGVSMDRVTSHDLTPRTDCTPPIAQSRWTEKDTDKEIAQFYPAAVGSVGSTRLATTTWSQKSANSVKTTDAEEENSIHPRDPTPDVLDILDIATPLSPAQLRDLWTSPTPCFLGGCRQKHYYNTYQSWLTHLRNVHQKSIRCTELSCNKLFANNTYLKRHVKAVHSKRPHKPFKCLRRGCTRKIKAWTRKDKWLLHESMWHKNFKCFFCSSEIEGGKEKWFDTDRELFEHTLIEHMEYQSLLNDRTEDRQTNKEIDGWF